MQDCEGVRKHSERFIKPLQPKAKGGRLTDMPIMIENINAQTITPALGKNPRQLYEHQEEAIRKLDAMDKRV